MPTKTKGKWVYLDDDVVKVHVTGADGKTHVETTLCWGDRVRVLPKRDGKIPVLLSRWETVPSKNGDGRPTRKYVQKEGFISGEAKFREDPVLKVRFVDVGQGDASIVETPKGRVLLLDGGEERHLLNYVRAAWAHVIRKKPLECASVIVTHGDADHYTGLSLLADASRNDDGDPVIVAERVFHNGLVKTGKKGGGEVAAFGATRKVDGATYVTDLHDDLLKVPDAKMAPSFRGWKRALERLKKARSKLKMSRLRYGDDAAFAFLQDEGIDVQVLGPIVDEVGGKEALPFLSTHGKRKSLSASHTVNGHSVVLKMTFGNVRFLFGADLNEESEERLLVKAREEGVSLSAEILKVPHHGSDDFSPRILEAISPVVSVVSSGDENAAKDYIHPRAGLVGALGKYARAGAHKPLVYVTEMVAFFRRVGPGSVRTIKNGKTAKDGKFVQNIYEKTVFGIVHVRTDGKRVLVTTASARTSNRESYVFFVDERGDVTFAEPSIL